MDSIITYLISYNQYLINIIFQLLIFISKYIPLGQLSFDDSNDPEYQKFNFHFFEMDLYQISQHATGFNLKKFNPHIMGLCLTYHVNLKLSTRQTAHALKEVHIIKISHTMVANYALTAAAVIKPFVDTFDYKPSKILSADETYIKVKGIKHYV